MCSALVAVSLFGQQPGHPSARQGSSETDAAKAVVEQHALEQRRELAERIVASRESAGREIMPRLRQAMVDALEKQPVAQLESQLASGLIAPLALGDTTADMTYTTFQQPCRIIDTRVAGGPLAAGIPRSFKVAGTAGFDLQGGTAGGCGVPVGATAVQINFVAVNAQGAGNLKGSAYPNPIPATGSVINYQLLAPALNVANAVTFPICDPSASTCSADMTLQANASGTDVVADVIGYFTPFPKAQVRPLFSSVSGTPITAINATCTTYGSVTVNAPVAGTAWVHANLKVSVNHSAASSAEFDVFLSPTPASCTINAHQLDYNWCFSGSDPSGVYYYPLTLGQYYNVPAGTTTFYLNAMQSYNGGDAGNLYQFGLVAEFVPN